MSLVGKKAPSFKVQAVVANDQRIDIELSQYEGKYVVLFFYPLDFTFVCPTELHAFQEKLEEFEKRNAVVLGCSIDSCFAHIAWLNTPKVKGGIEGIKYPLLSDIHKSIAESYGVLKSDEGIAYRGLFLMDKHGVIRHQLVNDLPLGRSVDEVIRTLDALIFHEKHGEVCPANWQVGKRGMQPNELGLVEYFQS
ncbi:MAG: thioredoxin peroxidase [Chlamydiae bacterium RIFCSPHIGHO2_12_FULL_44_59]|nr:MAG: thioredoxin peroxidase [Chlamydiae bacterium RIFCSPHIGHO2_01_FULL_44_39]OGN59245.1 MAG: thioredoxin peroxidase [Chlamydiae bacterium RIFCSPHIGHO2_02_FULL_45_9]OGN60427.1 MAG: thioredoxin peroxidase [Chlamydiae bacterium RIFCSPHIGHO2_12_FULL_44_59]OGN66548.1 MAG: thioredoxin peroxidase [Chlamydiae bacterium RIFCSPLOWO2_01_FULL_44_52]OGN69797.1 MAG: thioredoxin peroxidase [Chlamydiae bacterium RIFCSPLOWO2_02_FULL_45_22]OGN70337.1 MAG: thioredoxin peroxidase [Chlamydiae bacterium RIFCSPLO